MRKLLTAAICLLLCLALCLSACAAATRLILMVDGLERPAADPASESYVFDGREYQ